MRISSKHNSRYQHGLQLFAAYLVHVPVNKHAMQTHPPLTGNAQAEHVCHLSCAKSHIEQLGITQRAVEAPL
jgi:hypothetical protein